MSSSSLLPVPFDDVNDIPTDSKTNSPESKKGKKGRGGSRYKPLAAVEADVGSLYILDRLPEGRWRGRLLAEAARLAKADLNALIRAAGRWPTADDLRAALSPPPETPSPAAYRWQALGIVNERGGRTTPKLRAWADREAGAYADALSVHRQRVAEWGKWQAWRPVAIEAARLTTAIREYVGDSPYLAMIGHDYTDICQQAEADIGLAKRMLAGMRGCSPGEVEEVPSAEDVAYVLSWGLDLATSTGPLPEPEEIRYSPIRMEGGRWVHKGGLRRHDAEAVPMTLVIRNADGRWRHRGGIWEIEERETEAYADRLTDLRWHRRRLNRAVGRTCEHVALILRLVGAHGEYCCTEVALERRRSQIRRQLEFGRAMEQVSPDGGQRVAMAALMAASRQGQLASMWAIIQGMAEHAREEGLRPVWLTLTAPPEFHAAPEKGDDKWDPRLTPAAAKDWLQGQWARVRAWFSEQGMDPLGVWVAEPHKDECPHRHILLWVRPEQRKGLEAVIRRYWPSQAAARIEDKEDGATNSVARYIWAYLKPALMKTGHGWSDDGADDPAAERRASDQIEGKGGETAERYDAHASVWGYRRYGFFGLAKGTRSTWMKIYRWPKGEDMALPDGPFAEAKAAMDRMDWRGALEALGAFGERRFEFAYETRTNRYGESAKVCKGVSDGILSIRISCGWTIEAAAESNIDTDKGEGEHECFVDDDGYHSGLPDVWMESEAALTVVEKYPREAACAAPDDQPGGGGGRLKRALLARIAAAGPENLRL